MNNMLNSTQRNLYHTRIFIVGRDFTFNWYVRISDENFKVVYKTYVLDREHAEITKGMLINRFWSWQLN